MQITLGQQYNVGEKPTVILYIYINVVSHIQRIGCQPEKNTLHGGQSRSWSAEQGKENKRKSLAALCEISINQSKVQRVCLLFTRFIRRFRDNSEIIDTTKY